MGSDHLAVTYLYPLRGEGFAPGFWVCIARTDRRLAGPFRTEREAERELARHAALGTTP